MDEQFHYSIVFRFPLWETDITLINLERARDADPGTFFKEEKK